MIARDLSRLDVETMILGGGDCGGGSTIISAVEGGGPLRYAKGEAGVAETGECSLLVFEAVEEDVDRESCSSSSSSIILCSFIFELYFLLLWNERSNESTKKIMRQDAASPSQSTQDI